jgi:hypothetical protein
MLVVAAAAHPARTLAWVQGVDGGANNAEPAADVALPATVRMRAGQRVDILLRARDVFGNLTVWGTQEVGMEAQGTVNHEFDEEVFLTEESAAEQLVRVMSADILQTGTYSLIPTVDGKTPDGWPRTLQLMPGPVHPEATELRGDGVGDMYTGQVARLYISTMDEYGNAQLVGGQTVDLRVSRKAVAAGGDGLDRPWQGTDMEADPVRHLKVLDNRDGTYTAELVINQPGVWTAGVSLNHYPAPGVDLDMVVHSRGVLAQNCRIKRFNRSVKVPYYQFRKDTFLVSTIDDRERFTGEETVLLQVKSPSHAATTVVMEFVSTGQPSPGGYETSQWMGTVTWMENGTHTVAALVNFQHCRGSPLNLKVTARKITDPIPPDEFDGEMDGDYVVGAASREIQYARIGFTPQENAVFLRGQDVADKARVMRSMNPDDASRSIDFMDTEEVADMMVCPLTNIDAITAAEVLAGAGRSNCAGILRAMCKSVMTAQGDVDPKRTEVMSPLWP